MFDSLPSPVPNPGASPADGPATTNVRADPDLKRIAWAGAVGRRVAIALERLNFDEARAAIDWGEATYNESITAPTDAEETAIAELNLQPRVVNALEQMGKIMVCDLLSVSKSQLLSYPGIGERHMTEIEEALIEAGFGERPLSLLAIPARDRRDEPNERRSTG